jgi:Na+-driven multidrug efflux pump
LKFSTTIKVCFVYQKEKIMIDKQHPLKNITRLGWQPTLLAFATAMEGFVDTLFIAHIGLSAIEAVAIAGSILLIQVTIYEAFGSATRYFTSTAKNKKEAWKIIIQGAFLGCLVSLALGGVTILLTEQFFALYGVETTSNGVLYLQIVGGSCVFPALFGVVSHGLQGLAEQKSTTIAGLVITSTHLLLDYVLIYPLHLGLVGAAYAAMLSSLLGTGWIVAMFLRQAGSDIQWKMDWQLQKKMLSKALPQMLGNLSNQIGLVYYYAILARTGPEALAAVRILNVVERVVYATWMKGIIYTISPVVGPLTNEKKLVARYIRWAMGTVMIGTFVSWIIQLILAHVVVGLFTDDPAILELAVWLILLYAWVNGLWYVYACVEEVFGVHKQIQTTATINTLSSVVLVIGCWLASPTLVGVTYAEAVQYLVIGTVSVAYLCGYYKHAGISLFPFRETISNILRRAKKKHILLDDEGMKNPVDRANNAINALFALESAKRDPIKGLPIENALRTVKQLLEDALAVIESDELQQERFVESNKMDWAKFENSQEIFEFYVQRAKKDAKGQFPLNLGELGELLDYVQSLYLPGVNLREAYEAYEFFLNNDGTVDRVKYAYEALLALESVNMWQIIELPIDYALHTAKQIMKDALTVIETDELQKKLFADAFGWNKHGYEFENSKKAYELIISSAYIKAVLPRSIAEVESELRKAQIFLPEANTAMALDTLSKVEI